MDGQPVIESIARMRVVEWNEQSVWEGMVNGVKSSEGRVTFAGLNDLP